MAARANQTNKILLASAVAGLMAMANTAAVNAADATDGEKVKCYGTKESKDASGSKGAAHACGGKNGCQGENYIEVDSKEACLKLEGGRLTPKK